MKTWWVDHGVGRLRLSVVSVAEIHDKPFWQPARRALSVAENQKANEIRVEWARKRYLATRAFVRQMLSDFVLPDLVIPPHQWRFEPGIHGRPEVVFPKVPSLSFNLSHTPDRILCGISTDGTLGVDIETCTARIDMERMIRKVFAPAEQARLNATESVEEKKRLFFVFWTLKEAYLKGLGTGIVLPLQYVDFGDSRFSQKGIATRLRLHPTIPDDESRWRFSLHQSIGGHQIGTALRL